MKRQIIFVLFFGLVLNTLAQSDSLAFVNGPWLSERVDGLVLRRCQFEQESLFASNQHILVWELSDTDDFALQFAYRPERTKTSDMAKEQHAVAAVNGSFFNMERHFPVLFLRINGEDLGQTTQEEAKLQTENYCFGTLALAHDSVFILKNDTVSQWEKGLPYPDMMTARPLLIFEGEALPLQEDLGFVNDRHNRTAVGIRDDGTVLLIVVDGLSDAVSGMARRRYGMVPFMSAGVPHRTAPDTLSRAVSPSYARFLSAHAARCAPALNPVTNTRSGSAWYSIASPDDAHFMASSTSFLISDRFIFFQS